MPFAASVRKLELKSVGHGAAKALLRMMASCPLQHIIIDDSEVVIRGEVGFSCERVNLSSLHTLEIALTTPTLEATVWLDVLNFEELGSLHLRFNRPRGYLSDSHIRWLWEKEGGCLERLQKLLNRGHAVPLFAKADHIRMTYQSFNQNLETDCQDSRTTAQHGLDLKRRLRLPNTLQGKITFEAVRAS